MWILLRAVVCSLLLVGPVWAASTPQTQDTNLAKMGGTSLSGANVVDTGNNAFKVNCVVGCTPVSSFTDNSAFTAGTTVETNIGGVFNDGLAAISSGSAAAARITPSRGVHINLRNQSGTELATGGNPLRVDPTGSTTQPISGSVTVSGTVTANQGGAPWAVRLQDGSGATLGAVTAGNALKVDGSAVTQPVSGSVSVTGTPGVNLSQLGGTALTGANVVDGANTAFRINCVVGCLTSGFVDSATFTITTSTGGVMMATFNDAAANLTAGQAGALRATTDRMLFTNLGKIAGTATSTGVGAAGAGTQRVVDVASGTTGAAPPAQAVFGGGLSSGATGGFLQGYTVCDLSKAINISTATTTLMVTGVSGRQVRICSFHMVTAAANNVAWIEGTGATCGTGTAGMAGGTTAATGYNLAANAVIGFGSGLGEVLTTATTGDSVCLVTSAGTQLSGFIKYTIY